MHSESDTTTTTGTKPQTRADRIMIAVININSIQSKGKGGAFKAYIQTKNPGIVIASETCISSDFVDDDILPFNFMSVHDDKCATKHGVLIAHKTNLIVSQADLINKTSEFVPTRLQVVGNSDVYIGSFCQHTNSDPSSLKTLHDNIKKLTKGKKFPNFIVAGEFNLADTNWHQYRISPIHSMEKKLNELYLTQMVVE